MIPQQYSYGAIGDHRRDDQAWQNSNKSLSTTGTNDTEPVYHYDDDYINNEKNPTAYKRRSIHSLSSTYHRSSIFFFATIILVITLSCSLLVSYYYCDDTKELNNKFETRSHDEYEYIVVGAGPAGIITAVSLARKLLQEAKENSHDTVGKVLLLESGTLSQGAVEQSTLYGAASSSLNDGNDNDDKDDKQQQQQQPLVNEFDIPFMWNDCNSQGQGEEGMNRFLTHHWPVEGTIVGRAVGGSGLHNAMINVRALPDDFKKWNVTNWSAEEMMPYFDRLETYVNDVTTTTQAGSATTTSFWGTLSSSSSLLPPDIQRRGRSGPLLTSPANNDIVDPISISFISSSLAAGLPLASLGFNDQDVSRRVGAGFYEFNVYNGLRDSVAKAFLTSDSPAEVPRQHSRNINVNTHDENKINMVVPHNLVLQRDATVQKIIFEKANHPSSLPKAIGVTYYSSTKGQTHHAHLIRSPGNIVRESPLHRLLLRGKNQRRRRRPPEVILSAGAIFSPQILANSGIHEGGSLIDAHGVGKNLQDHPVIALAFEVKEDLGKAISSYFSGSETGMGGGDTNASFEAYLESVSDLLYEAKGQKKTNGTTTSHSYYSVGGGEHGNVYGTPGFSSGAFLTSPWSLEEDGIPDIQLTVFPDIKEPHFAMMKRGALKSELGGSQMIMVTVALLTPEARSKLKFARAPIGSIRDMGEELSTTRQDSSHALHPKANFEEYYQFGVPDIVNENTDSSGNGGSYLTDRDVHRLSWGIGEVRRIMLAQPLSLNITTEAFPGADVRGLDLNDFVKKNIMRNSHWCGSTRMGDSNVGEREQDHGAVVDEKLRVKGVLQTRVIDAGVMPFVPNGNTHATTCAIAMRGADLIFEDD